MAPPPPPPPPKSLRPDEKPISPPLKSLPYHQPPQKRKGKSLIWALIFGTLLTISIGLTLYYLQVSISVILPALAPIWVGSITLIYSVNSKN